MGGNFPRVRWCWKRQVCCRMTLRIHQAVAILQGRGFDVRYEGKTLQADDSQVLEPVTDEFIRSLRGCCKGENSLVEAREREHRIEKHRMPK
jgi:hypothetical protein